MVVVWGVGKDGGRSNVECTCVCVWGSKSDCFGWYVCRAMLMCVCETVCGVLFVEQCGAVWIILGQCGVVYIEQCGAVECCIGQCRAVWTSVGLCGSVWTTWNSVKQCA